MDFLPSAERQRGKEKWKMGNGIIPLIPSSPLTSGKQEPIHWVPAGTFRITIQNSLNDVIGDKQLFDHRSFYERDGNRTIIYQALMEEGERKGFLEFITEMVA